MKRQIINSDCTADVYDINSVQAPREKDKSHTQRTTPSWKTLIAKMSGGHSNSVSAPTGDTQQYQISQLERCHDLMHTLFVLGAPDLRNGSWWVPGLPAGLHWCDLSGVSLLSLPTDCPLNLFIRKDAFRAEKQSLWHTTGLTDLDELFYFNVNLL